MLEVIVTAGKAVVLSRFDTFLLFQILSSFVYAVGFRIGWSWVMSFVVIVCHEMALGLGLGKWIVDEGPRTDLISANRYYLTLSGRA